MVDINKCLTSKTKDARCFKLLEFPNKPKKTQIIPKIEHFNFFSDEFNNVVLTKAIHVKPDNKLVVPHTLKKELTQNKKKFTITPIILYTHDMYGLFKNDDKWYVFKTPGSNLINGTSSLEYKIISLIEDKFKLEVDLFYVNILYAPPYKSEDDLWWHSYIIYETIKHPDLEREILINKLIVDVIKSTSNYTSFIKKFKSFISKV